MVNINDAAQHIGIDYLDDGMTATNLRRALDSAIYRLYGAVGRDVEEHLGDDPRVDHLVLIYTEEAYDNHPGSAKQDAAKNHLRDTLELQLRLELRTLREAGGEADALL
jgi:hypothetical protein